jgi:hypothetical protein
MCTVLLVQVTPANIQLLPCIQLSVPHFQHACLQKDFSCAQSDFNWAHKMTKICGQLILLFDSCICAGPSTACSLTVLQPPAAGKTLTTRPAYKGMLRSKYPVACGFGALARLLIVRFKLKMESIPRPGTKQWKRFYLWPGRQGKG